MTQHSTDFLLDRLTRLHPKLIDLTLDRMTGLLAAIGNPHTMLPPVIHVAGTNGKGSVIACMRAILVAAGYRVHVYTSPHLVRFHERIEIDGAHIPEADLASILDECERANAGAQITFFEITTAAAFLAFSRTSADLVLMETGLGGRLDATNVVTQPLATVITPVSLDHQQFLGNAIPEIAYEKAGIIKSGVPLITGPQEPAAASVIAARARELGAPLMAAGENFSVSSDSPGRLTYQDDAGVLEVPEPALPGKHQHWNAATAIAALRGHVRFPVPLSAFAQGLRTVCWPARLQRIRSGRLSRLAGAQIELWLDGGHNPAAGQVLADMASGWTDKPLDIVVAMMNTKDPAGFIRFLVPHVRNAVTLAIPGEKNSLTATETQDVLRSSGLQSQQADSIESAIGMLREKSRGPSRLLVCGSLYLAGRVLESNT